MKQTQIIHDGNIVATPDGHDLTAAGTAAIIQKNAPCEIVFLEDDQVINRMTFDGRNQLRKEAFDE